MRILLVCSGNSELGISPIVKSQGDSLQKAGVNIEYFLVKGRGLAGYLKNIKRLKKYLAVSHFDLMHAHYGFCGIISHFGRKKKKLIVSFMGEDLLASYHFDGSYTLISRIYVKINLFFARKYFDFVIVKSAEMSKVLRMPANSAIIPNGVNPDVFRPIDKDKARKQLGISEDVKLVIFVSNPERPEKNYRLAKEAFDLLDVEKKEIRPVFNVPQEELPLYYNAADVLLLTSFHEGSPNVIKEAMACNCPIVATDVGDVKELLSGQDGCYISSFNRKDVADCLKKAILSGKKRTNCRAYITENLDSGRIAEKLINIYHSLLPL
jgi:glycosyltransferase involved in cell wall biosynthesis